MKARNHAILVSGLFFLGAWGASQVIEGCATEDYRYEPATHRASSRREAIYDEPPISPSGTVRVQFVGIEDYPVHPNRPKVNALHLRFIASNHASVGDWDVNAQDMSVSFPDGYESPVLAANPPTLQIPPGGLLGTDVYFTLPNKMSSSDQLPEFDFHWKAMAVGRPIAETTAFDRVRLPRYYAGGSPYWDGFGGYGPFEPYGRDYTAGLGDGQ